MATPQESESPAANAADDNADVTQNGQSLNAVDSTVTPQEYDGMQTILSNVYAFRTPDGDDPSKIFHRKVNRRMVPDYYDVIQEPMAMSAIKAKINTREYKTFEEFVRDFALICHNAQVYNSPSAQAYQDALTIKSVLEKQLAQLVAKGVVTSERAELPFLGEIPPSDEPILEEVDEDDDEDDEDDEDDDSEEETKKKRKRGRPSLASKREREERDKDDEPDTRKKRGRPPRVDTPMEARIKAVMKGLRKPKNSHGELMIGHFERLPDKAALPEYFKEIKQPIALDVVKKKLKRKKYITMEQFMKDLELMFENAKQYNEDASEIYKDAVALQQEARSLAEQEKNRPDTDFVMEDGRIPLPDGILHNGELWKVGDWVHIQNPNDLTKPIVAQIYRTYQDQDGGKWINACWYYRPEQTVHRFDKHFFENEVVKTGQYRDHPIDEIVDRCFVMFFTRFNKGRPRGFPADKEVYVCEARYNEEKHKINKIKTWASCLPDEVRDKDYEMDLFDVPKKLKKIPSPIKYLFKEDEQKVSDDLPKPVWGAPNAPPKIGAVHCRPRDPKESPPPEPTPSPPPQPPPQPVRQMSSHQSNGFSIERPSNINIAAANHQVALQPTPTPQSLTAQNFNQTHPTQYHHASTPTASHQASGRAAPFGGSAQTFAVQHTPQTMAQFSNHQQHSFQQHRGPAQVSATTYKEPKAIEVWTLPSSLRDSIPAEVRAQYHTDASGNIIFFTAPPVAAAEPADGKKLKHSAAYLAFRARQQQDKTSQVTKRQPEYETSATLGAEIDGSAPKRARVTQDGSLDGLDVDAMAHINELLANATIEQFKELYGNDRWSGALDLHLKMIAEAQQGAAARLPEEKKLDSIGKHGLTSLLNYRPPNEALEWRR